jgi:hypothetical protein
MVVLNIVSIETWEWQDEYSSRCMNHGEHLVMDQNLTISTP